MKKLINEVSFSLPCRVFTVSYSVTEKRQLPVVKEFVVRLLYEIDQCNPEILANFFGFNSQEIKIVLEDLIYESLIQWDGDEVRLSSYAKENFTEVEGNAVPRFFQIADMTDRVSFDLFLFKFLGNDLRKLGRKFLCIDVPLPDDSYKGVIDKVKSAFHDQFMHYQSEVKDIDLFSDDSVELYKINHVESLFDQLIPIPVSYYYDGSSQDIVMEYDLPEIAEWDSERQIFNTIDNAIEMASVNESNQTNNVMNYVAYVRDPFLVRMIRSENSDYSTEELKMITQQVSYTQLLTIYKNEEHKVFEGNLQTLMIVGNLYTKDNREILEKIIRRAAKNDESKYLPGALWFTNFQDKTWGRTDHLTATIEMVNQLFDKEPGNVSLVINTPCYGENDAYEISSKYKFSGAKFHSCGNIFDSEQIELLLIPDLLVASVFHFKTNDSRELTIPIGFITKNKEIIEKITKNIRNWSNKPESKFDERDEFHKSGKSIRETVILPVLNYYEEDEKAKRQERIERDKNITRKNFPDESD